MKDFISAAKKAATGPKNDKSKPSRSDDNRARDVSRADNSAASIKAGLKGSKGDAASKPGVGGSSAGLRNQSKATLRVDGKSPRNKKSDIKILESSGPSASMVGRTRGSIPQMVDYTLKGNSGNNNSIASLEGRTKLDRMFR